MKTSVYTTGFGLTTPRGASFDVRDALANWAVYADQISVAAGDDESADLFITHAAALGIGHLLTITRTTFDFTNDSFAYGKTENAALQACTGDFLIQANLDERICGAKDKLEDLYRALASTPDLQAFWVPTIDLYGSKERCLPEVGRKWRLHKRGLSRGAVSFGIKPDGAPSYDVTSTDELLQPNGSLANTASLIPDHSLPALRAYAAAGWPITFHTGFLSLGDRIHRSLWWKGFWEMATRGDSNRHATTVEELAARATVDHGLPLWPTIAP